MNLKPFFRNTLLHSLLLLTFCTPAVHAEEADPGDVAVVPEAADVVPNDVWERIRSGFKVPDLNSPTVDRWVKRYASDPAYMSRMADRASRYLYNIVEEVDARGMPMELALLPFVESAFQPEALSRAKAAGLWQFMPGTAREFNLEVNNHVDERYHVEKSTQAACKYLKQAYARFGNWESVAASYNAGQGRISKQMDSQYADNALDLQLVEETARYVYRILAAKMMLTNPKQFGFRLKSSDLYPIIPYRNITVEESIDDLARFAKGQGINYALLRNMNPWLRSSSLPNHGKKKYILAIPDKEKMHYNPKVTIPYNRNWVTE